MPAVANNLSMWWRRRIVLAAKPPLFGREASVLERLVATTDNAAVAELAKIRLRVLRFLGDRNEIGGDRRQTDAIPVTDAEVAAVIRALPQTRTPVPAAHLVDVRAKANTLDRLRMLNLDRYDRSRESLAWPTPSRVVDPQLFLALLFAVSTVLLCIVLSRPQSIARLVSDRIGEMNNANRAGLLFLLASPVLIAPWCIRAWLSRRCARAEVHAQYQLWSNVDRVAITTTEGGVEVVVMRKRGCPYTMSYTALKTTPEERALIIALEIDRRRPSVPIFLNGEPWWIAEAVAPERES